MSSSTDTALTSARFILVGIQTVGTSAPIPGIGPVTDTLIGLIDKIVETRSNHKGLKAVSDAVTKLVNMLNRVVTKVKRDLDDIPSGDERRHAVVDGLKGSSELEKRVMRLNGELEGLQSTADKLCQGCWLRRWFYSSQDAATLEELREGIAEFTHHFELECIVTIESLVTDVNAIVMQEAAKNAKDRDEKALESLPHADASYRAAAVNVTKSSFLPGTRVELFEKINDWIERPQESSNKAVCVLKGGAGTGKSTIASEFAHMRSKKGDYGTSFFFVRGEADLDSTRLVFPTLAYQLAKSQDALRPHIITAARKHLDKGDKIQQMRFQAPELFHGPVHEVSNEHPPIVIVVDAVDKCSKEMHDGVPEMLGYLLESVHQAQFPLRIFFTSESHPESLVEKTLYSPQWKSLVHTISLNDLPPESVQRDMAIFVRDKITKMPSGQALLQERPHVADKLAERAEGMFVYAKIAVDFLNDYPGFVADGLDKLLSGGSSQYAAELKPLDDLYLTILEVVFPPVNLGDTNPSLSRALQPTLGSLAVLRNPMSPAVLERLTGVPSKDVCNVLSSLRAVVLFDETQPDAKFRATHATFPQFLVDPKRCMDKSYHVVATHQNSTLVVACLRILQKLDVNICRLPDPTVPRADVPDLAERLRTYVPEHVEYACLHWAAHLSNACRVKTRKPTTTCACWNIGETLTTFAQTKLGVWVEIMAYIGRLDTVTEALDAAQAYFKGASEYRELDSLLAEMKQIVVDHYSKIEECPSYVHQRSLTSTSGAIAPDPVDDGQLYEAL